MLIPLWRHPRYSSSHFRLRLLSSKKYPHQYSYHDLFSANPDSDKDSPNKRQIATPENAIDTTFICPLTGQNLPECSCVKSSLKLHDFCVFCPAAKMHLISSNTLKNSPNYQINSH